MTETEIKSIIDEDCYRRVCDAFRWDSIKEQVNYYYTDKNGLLREKRIMVRVRVVDGISRLQVKYHKNENSPLQICEENEYEINGVSDVLDAETAKTVTGIDAGELYCMGSASTRRHSFFHGDCELCLDRTKYFGKTDYEVEVEYKDKMSADLLMRLTRLGVSFTQKCVGKFARFLAEYERQNGKAGE